ncbi:selenide, water dikinase SelD [Histidinibacterium aquaticum]|uniref:Selenide, water dikinase SelD n=1 Tax=Histidinibacterium aquaticum TaxID=2613962 RepID=A0A5J5GGY6_9RHOB|nr:selenide, water dikinase SelD [Histidinibacterium aquaticum]KAA9006998.1 selenide, water dikinase SelD [Histidinibacterium aquaticum]
MQATIPLTRDIVLVGGGHTHALVLRKWGMAPVPGVRLTLIDPNPAAAYSGMLPGYVAGHYGRDELDIDLVRLARFAGARLILAAADGIDLVAREVRVPGRPAVGFDVCSLDIGITSDMPQIEGFAEHAVPAKPLGPFSRRWSAWLEQAGQPRIAVIGGGVAGGELAMAMAHAVRGRNATIRLIDRGEILDDFNPRPRNALVDAVTGLGIEPVEQAEIARISADGVHLADGTLIEADFVAGAAGARPHGWLDGAGLDLHDGFVSVGPTLQSSDPRVFAAGDCAHLSHAPRPKAGVYAVRAAPVLFENLRAAVTGGRMRRYRPQRDYLKLISLGGKRALAERGGRQLSGAPMWRWKDHIDRRFMRRFDDLPEMTSDLPPLVAEGVSETLGGAPLCGGCGAKIGRGTLGRAVAALPRRRDDVESRPGDDAAILNMGGVRQVVTTDHLRAVTEDPVLMTRIAVIHALGDIWAMGAAPQTALLSLILPRMSSDLQARTMAEIMATADEMLAAEGAEIVGGHSTMGAEMTLGVTLTGLAPERAITLAGAQPGDALILTKPLGTGVLLAAEMRGLARGADVAQAYEVMTRSQGEAARALSGAHAMTDVTGFGLAGHLMGICQASGVGAELDLDAVLLLPGALDLARQGVRSTLWPENRTVLPEAPDDPRADLLFDPQTCGGLLAAVPDGPAVLSALEATGTRAAQIGRVTDAPPGITLR